MHPFPPNRRRRIAAAAALICACAGCSTPRTAPAAPEAPPPPAAKPRPSACNPAEPRRPVYRNPKIAVVTLRAHEDAQGRLFGPQVMYQMSDPGGWNIEAVEDGGGFIPAANLEVPPPAPESLLLDPDRAARIALTGLMHPDDRVAAEAMAARAGGGTSAVFDREAGWLLVPGPGETR